MNDPDCASDEFSLDQDKNEEKRHAHTAAEQKRRDAIKNGLEQLQEIVPGCHQSDLNNGLQAKTSKAQILQKAIDYVSYMGQDRDRKKQEIEEMEKKLAALKIMKENYEQLVKNNDEPQKQVISDEVKFAVVQNLLKAKLKNLKNMRK